jgi:long-chain acyl-CoA synthetase
MLLKIPILRGIVKKKVLAGLGLDQASGRRAAPRRCRLDLLRWYRSLGLDIVEVYGMTENCGLSHATVPGKPRPGTVGPLRRRAVPHRPGDGEIQMKGAVPDAGLLQGARAHRATFTDDGWLKTGDKGAIDAEGNLKITGRVKDLFKTSKGKYVAPGADRGQAGHASARRGLLRDRRQPGPAAGRW